MYIVIYGHKKNLCCLPSYALSTWIYGSYAEHEFKKPNDERAMKLMNACAKAMFEDFPDIVFAYGVSDEYSFVFKKITEFYKRRPSKIVSIPVLFFTSVYVSPPSFDACTICFPSADGVRDYLAWRQAEFCKNNQHNTWFWMLVKKLSQQFGIKYTELPDIFCKGSCVFKDKAEEIVKYNENGESIVKRFRSKVIIDHCDIVGDKFWNDHVNILKDE
ncbi:hypothetical protein MKW92_046052 [Papaver armeniacum]|nr:hypothetical protein MKW92_046052 [Papaver armeniacum]